MNYDLGVIQKASRLLAESPTFLHVLEFAFDMEEKLSENRHKGDRLGWLADSSSDLMGRVWEEARELNDEIGYNGTPKAVWREAADVANCAMMAADCYENEQKS